MRSTSVANAGPYPNFRIAERVSVTNSGTADAKAKIDIEVLASPSGTADDTNNVSLTTIANKAINLKPGASKEFRANVKLPDSLLAGQNCILVKLDESNTVTESDENNNIVVSVESTIVADPFIDLVG